MARNVNQLFNFKEQRFTALTHKLRIYIFGEEVSGWLKGQLSITYGNRDSFNTASFELSNPRQLWQLTPDNLRGKWRPASAGEYSEEVKLKIFRRKNNPEINPKFSLNVTLNKFGQGGTPTTKKSPYGSSQIIHPKNTEEGRYRLALSDTIFNRYDPIRIFMHNPYSNGRTNEWMEVYCGFVLDHPVTTNWLNGESHVKISCACIREVMTRMRCQVNMFTTTLDPSPIFEDGFFSDFRSTGVMSHSMAGNTLEQAVAKLVLGTTQTVQSGFAPGGSFKVQTNGIGSFRPGNIVCYSPTGAGNTLSQWHLMTMFGVNKKPWPDSPANDLWLTAQEVTKLGRQTWAGPAIENDPLVGGPTARYLHMLLPEKGTGASQLVNFGVAEGAPPTREWTSRWEMIRDLASKLDFQVLTSPSGDILLEFPQYTFTPELYSFGTKGLQGIFTFNIHQKEDTVSDEAADFPNVLQVTGGVAHNAENVGTAPHGANIVVFVYSPALVSRYGVIVENHDIPFVGQQGADQSGAGEKSPILARLAKLGLIEFMKRSANSSTWDGSVVFRPFLFPNRPVEFIRSNRCAVLTTVTQTWNLMHEATTNLSVNMLMAKRLDGDPGGKGAYRVVTGSANMPIDYHDIWSEDSPGHKHSGVFSDTSSADPDKTATSEGNSDDQVNNQTLSPPSTDLKQLYPPFAALVQALLDGCAAKGLKVRVIETYRSGERQTEAKRKGFSKAEAFKSFHQFGLAVDIGPVGKSEAQQHEGTREIAVVNSELGLGLTWGGSFPNFYDGYHFEIPGTWDMKVAQARNIRAQFARPPISEQGAIQQVWSTLDGKPAVAQVKQQYMKSSVAIPAADDVAAANAKAAGKAPSTENAQKASTPTSPTTPLRPPAAPPCAPQYLTSAGLSNG